MESIHLIGAEDVRRAVGEMQDAAHSMKQAANLMSEVVGQQRDNMTEALDRFEALVTRFEAATESQAQEGRSLEVPLHCRWAGLVLCADVTGEPSGPVATTVADVTCKDCRALLDEMGAGHAPKQEAAPST